MTWFQCDGILIFIFKRIETTAQKMSQHGSIGTGVQMLLTKMLPSDAVTAHSTLLMMNAVGSKLSKFLNKKIILVTCCSTVNLTSSDSAFLNGWYGSQFAGTYNVYATSPEWNGRTVYQLNDYCLYFSPYSKWNINSCSSLGSGG